MFIIRNRRYFFFFSLLLVVASLISLFTYGLNLGTDFKGGAIFEVDYPAGRPDADKLKSFFQSYGEPLTYQTSGETGLVIKAKELAQEDRSAILSALSLEGKYKPVEKQFSFVGPSLGQELARKGFIAIALVVTLIILFIAFAFRQVSQPVKSWKYGVIAIVALMHDVIISAGAMSLFAYFLGAEADALFLTALLTILGLSINDTIVIFDRVRENLRNHSGKTFEESIGISLDQTIVRSINVTLTIVLVLISMIAFGPISTKTFSMVLLVGMVIGAYSSIFLAAPLLVEWERAQSKKALKTSNR